MDEKYHVIALDWDELNHLLHLVGVDIGWQIKHGHEDKAAIAKSIYGKLKAAKNSPRRLVRGPEGVWYVERRA